VNLISTLSDPKSNMKSTISGQSRQPAVIEVNRESRAVGMNFYKLVETIPRQRCVKKVEGACLRCIYDAWNSAPGRRFTKWYWKDEEVTMLPEEVRTVVTEAGGRIPYHKSTTDTKGDIHWIHFAVDEFVLKPSGKERYLFSRELDSKYFFNFKKKDVEGIKRFSCMVKPRVYGGVLRVLKILVKWMGLEECLVRILGAHGNKGGGGRRGSRHLEEGEDGTRSWGH
jgi:hypothetical protein